MCKGVVCAVLRCVYESLNIYLHQVAFSNNHQPVCGPLVHVLHLNQLAGRIFAGSLAFLYSGYFSPAKHDTQSAQ